MRKVEEDTTVSILHVRLRERRIDRLLNAEHISLHCVFAQLVWLQVSWWTFGRVQVPVLGANLVDWWNSTIFAMPKVFKKGLAAVRIYTVRNLWEERNRRIFEQVAAAPLCIMALIKEEIKLKCLAGGQGMLPHRGF